LASFIYRLTLFYRKKTNAKSGVLTGFVDYKIVTGVDTGNGIELPVWTPVTASVVFEKIASSYESSYSLYG